MIVVGRENGMPVAYLAGILNSELIDLWFAIRGRNPRDVWRDYEPKPMNAIPYRPANGDPRAEQIAELVRAIAANRRTLLPHRAVVRELERTVKDPWRTGPVEIDERALVRELPAAETVSVRLHPLLRLELAEPGAARVQRAGPDVLELRRGRTLVGTLAGNEAAVEFVEHLLAGRADERLPELLVPKDLDAFARRVAERTRGVEALLAEGRDLVEQVERLVCAVYDVPDDLTGQVVAQAVRRAG